ncbi:galactose oxidase [Neoconidiobolus thromboides FSU 785]|nr:galactose oxidase [Neoconidiobolus thromboides FSU 785]
MIFYFLLFYHCLLASDIINTNIYGGECNLIGSRLYYLGGKDMTLGEGEHSSQSIAIRYLDLNESFNLTLLNKAPWKQIQSNFITAEPILYPQSTVNEDFIYLLGGLNQSTNNQFKVFDTKTNNFTTIINNNDINNNDIDLPILNHSLAYGTLVTTASNDYLLYGGMTQYSNNTIYSNPNVYKYNDKEWMVDNMMPGLPSFLHTSNIIDNKMYVIGGINPITLIPYPWDNVRVYDLNNKLWYNVTLSGKIPTIRYGHRSLVYDNSTILIVGGSTGINGTNLKDIEYSKEILILNLMTFEYESLIMEDFIGSFRGCAVLFNNYLLYSFGQNQFTSFNYSITNLVNLNQLKLTKEYIYNTVPLKHSDISNTLKVIIGFCLMLGILLFLLLLALILYKLHKYLNRERLISDDPGSNNSSKYSFFKPVSVLTQPIWCDTTSQHELKLSITNSDPILKSNDIKKSLHLSTLDHGTMILPTTTTNTMNNSAATTHHTHYSAPSQQLQPTTIHQFQFNKFPYFTKFIESQSMTSRPSNSTNSSNKSNKSDQRTTTSNSVPVNYKSKGSIFNISNNSSNLQSKFDTKNTSPSSQVTDFKNLNHSHYLNTNITTNLSEDKASLPNSSPQTAHSYLTKSVSPKDRCQGDVVVQFIPPEKAVLNQKISKEGVTMDKLPSIKVHDTETQKEGRRDIGVSKETISLSVGNVKPVAINYENELKDFIPYRRRHLKSIKKKMELNNGTHKKKNSIKEGSVKKYRMKKKGMKKGIGTSLSSQLLLEGFDNIIGDKYNTSNNTTTSTTTGTSNKESGSSNDKSHKNQLLEPIPVLPPIRKATDISINQFLSKEFKN